MNDALMERLQLFLTKEGNQSLLGTPATEEQIAEAEKQLGLSLDQDYVQFIRSFGGAYAGLPVHAFSNGSSIGRESVTELTLSFREDYKDTAMSGLLARSAVFSMDGSGNPILLDPEGRVLLIDHDNGDYEVIAESFAALIEENFMEW
ncbi:cell wall assembly/cell proliferation coordinating protein, KNR4-like protein [Paenibacillus sp. FSL R7-277]|uniref:SMI1/KNR4 family protein n=1 Tax=unclassified Paenibacillus TaxID=185978 RepID=UPI0003E23D98|nr:cell wall assembly/cell proliferation coordinating protein, KNR4-like protein [Paenibacillus sp. FSL R7-277]